MSPRFIVVNVGALAIAASAWASGWFAILSMLEWSEIAMLIFLAGYFAVGIVAAARGAFETVHHVMDGLPMWGLCFTGVSLIIAVSHLTSNDPEVLFVVFKYMALAILPNVLGVYLMIWLREVVHWSRDPDEAV